MLIEKGPETFDNCLVYRMCSTMFAESFLELAFSSDFAANSE